MNDITLNTESRLFIIPCGGGFSCLGFDVANRPYRDWET